MANLTNYLESEGSKTVELQERIVKYRKQFNINQNKMAEMLNIPRSTYAYLEKKATKLSIYFVEQVAAALKIPTEWIWYGEKNPEPTIIRQPTPKPEPKPDFLTLTNSEKKIVEKYRLLPLEARKEIRELVDNLYLQIKMKKQ